MQPIAHARACMRVHGKKLMSHIGFIRIDPDHPDRMNKFNGLPDVLTLTRHPDQP